MAAASYQGWADCADDQFLSAAEKKFDVLVALDTNLRIRRTFGPEKSVPWQ